MRGKMKAFKEAVLELWTAFTKFFTEFKFRPSYGGYIAYIVGLILILFAQYGEGFIYASLSIIMVASAFLSVLSLRKLNFERSKLERHIAQISEKRREEAIKAGEEDDEENMTAMLYLDEKVQKGVKRHLRVYKIVLGFHLFAFLVTSTVFVDLIFDVTGLM